VVRLVSVGVSEVETCPADDSMRRLVEPGSAVGKIQSYEAASDVGDWSFTAFEMETVGSNRRGTGGSLQPACTAAQAPGTGPGPGPGPGPSASLIKN
jgi:hypothetical protein